LYIVGMKAFLFLMAALWAVAALPLPARGEEPAASSAPATPPQKTCNIGPVTKNFGDSAWLVYSCDDNSTLIIIAANDNPAKPFYFKFFQSDGRYHLHGEGRGDREATKSTFGVLKALSKSDIEGLIAATKSTAKP